MEGEVVRQDITHLETPAFLRLQVHHMLFLMVVGVVRQGTTLLEIVVLPLAIALVTHSLTEGGAALAAITVQAIVAFLTNLYCALEL